MEIGNTERMKYSEFTATLREIAEHHKTLYVMGCFGAPLTEANKKRYIAHHAYNAAPERRAKIVGASADTFGFDCVCLVKGVLWGWSGDKNAIYGGADYCRGGVPDIGTEQMIAACSGVSRDFDRVVPGELLHMPGHVGVYIGGGLAVECTPAWADGVQITAVGNIGTVPGKNTRTWVEHGRLPYIEYDDVPQAAPADKPDDGYTDYTVVSGDSLWGIAASLLGDGSRWREIAACNNLDDAIIYVGQVLRIPIPTGNQASAPQPQPEPQPQPRTYTVRAGDSLWGIAASTLGDGTRYGEIKEINKLTSDMIYAGQVLRIPEK